MNYMNRFTAFIILLLLTTTACADDSAQKRPFLDYWMAIYDGVNQAGCLHVTLSCDTLDGQEVFRREEHFYMKCKDSSRAANVELIETTYVDSHFAPVFYRLTVDSKATPATLKFDTYAVCEIDYINKTRKTSVSSGNKRKKETVQEDIDPSALDYSLKFNTRRLKVGDILTCDTYEYTGPTPPVIGESDFTRITSEVEVLRREKVKINNNTYNALVLQQKSDMGDSIIWQLDNGIVVKQEMLFDEMLFTSTTERQAQRWIKSGWFDFDSIPCKQIVDDLERLVYMQVKLIGIGDEESVISDTRQTAEYDSTTKTANYKIKTSSFDPQKSITLPVVDPKMKDWLAPAEGIESDNKTIRKTALKIIGSTKNAYNAACKIREWVFDNIEYDLEASDTPLSAVTILKKKKGVCSHFAVLYTALARSVGIPTYCASGAACLGKDFGWHGWVESYVAEWVPLDPTWQDDSFQARYIKMWTGNTEVLYDSADMRGQVRAEITGLGYKAAETRKSGKKTKRWSPDPGQAYIFYPNGTTVNLSNKGEICFLEQMDTTGGETVLTTNKRSFKIPAESKILPEAKKVTTPTGDTLIDLLGHMTIELPDKTMVVLPPGSKLLASE